MKHNDSFPRKWAFILTLAIAMISPSSLSAAQIDEQCEKHWILDSGAILSITGSVDSRMLQQWRTREAQCQLSSVYWGRLAIIYINLNDLSNAKAALEKATADAGRYGFVSEAAQIQFLVQERMNRPEPLTKDDIFLFASRYKDLVKKYPHWPTGYALLGSTLTLLEQHREAVKALQVALGGDAYQLQSVYRSLTISLSALGDHENALVAADKAIVRNRALTGDPQFAYAVAISHAALGYHEDADNAIKIILAKRPDVKNDPAFQKTEAFCRRAAAMAKKNAKNKSLNL